MKKHNTLGGLLMAAGMAALLMAGCQKDNTTLCARMGHFDSSSKVYINGYNPVWTTGDQVVINNQTVTVEGSGSTVTMTVPTAAVYNALFPADYVTDITHLNIPRVQRYETDANGHQLVKAPMGAYSDASTTLQFTPMASLLAVQVSNDAGHGILTVDSVVVKASSVALWGSATVHNLIQNSRHYTLDNPYAAGDNDSVVLAGLNADGTLTSMALDVAQGGSATVHLYIPAIGNEVSNKFTVSVYAHTATGSSASYRYSLTQQNDFSGNIPCGKLAGVPFTLSADNETVLECVLYYTTSDNDNLQSYIEAIATANNTTVTITGSQSEGWEAAFAEPITHIPEEAFGRYDYDLAEYVGCWNLTTVTIPNSVTSIDDFAFRNCTRLTTVTIPNSVTSIGGCAFDECYSLTSVTIPNSVTSIGGGAFGECISLTSVTIPNSVTSIGEYVFSSCSNLTSVTIPNSVTSIANSAFYECYNLTSVTIPNSVTSIGVGAFEGCRSLTSVTIPNSVTSIGVGAFDGCSSLTSVTIPNSVTSIANRAFYECYNLTSVTIPNSVTSIGNYAFYYCRLNTVTIPNSVTSIGDEAFRYCSLGNVYCLAITPPSLGRTPFSNISSSAQLHVPASAVSAYRTAGWGGYFRIFGDAPTSKSTRN